MHNLNQLSDEELVGLYREGNERAFNELYARYSVKLKKLIYYYLGNYDIINDILSESFIRVVKHIDNFNIELTFSSWVYQITINCCKNFIKSKKRQDVILEKQKFKIEGVENYTPSTEDIVINEFDLEAFNSGIDSLKDKFRDVFVLRYDHRLKYEEISRILNCSERTAKWRMKKAIEIISQHLKDNGII
ncbi:RNA polymerase sigma factor [Spirochaetota bacterium]